MVSETLRESNWHMSVSGFRRHRQRRLEDAGQELLRVEAARGEGAAVRNEEHQEQGEVRRQVRANLPMEHC